MPSKETPSSDLLSAGVVAVSALSEDDQSMSIGSKTADALYITQSMLQPLFYSHLDLKVNIK